MSEEYLHKVYGKATVVLDGGEYTIDDLKEIIFLAESRSNQLSESMIATKSRQDELNGS